MCKGFVMIAISDGLHLTEIKARAVLKRDNRRRRLLFGTDYARPGEFNCVAGVDGEPQSGFGVIECGDQAIVAGRCAKRQREAMIIGDKLADLPSRRRQ